MQSNNVVQFPWQLTSQTVFQQALQAEGLVAASLEEYSAPFSQADFNHLKLKFSCKVWMSVYCITSWLKVFQRFNWYKVVHMASNAERIFFCFSSDP
jgi:hypothetical protein